MSITISPKNLSGTITIPPSKSMAHRLIICASLAKGKSTVSNIALSDDIKATISAFTAMGRDIEYKDGKCIISGDTAYDSSIIDCNESGSTLRFLVPIISALGGGTLTGQKRLGERPLTVYDNIFKQQNLGLSVGFPLIIQGGLRAGHFKVRGDISSQFISGLLLAAPLLDGNVKITITTKLESKNYVDMTIFAMQAYGIKVDVLEPNREYLIRGGQTYKACDSTCEGDWSQAGFWIVSGLNSKEGITLKGLSKSSLQGDKVIYDIAKQMNANIAFEDDKLIINKSELVKAYVDISQCPDLAPVVASMMSLTGQKCIMSGCKRLKIKESDRVLSIINALTGVGSTAIEKHDSIIIENKPVGGKIETYNDHRIAMMAAAISCHCISEVKVDDETVVKKSYPNFWYDFSSLGGIYV